MVKKCFKCKVQKSVADFYKSKRDGYQSYCKPCANKRRTRYYKSNRKQENKKRRNYEKSKRDWYIDYKKTLRCENCSESRWYVLDFHHINKNKEKNVSNMIETYSVENILKEIKKCKTLCSNCHRELHFLEKQNAPLV